MAGDVFGEVGGDQQGLPVGVLGDGAVADAIGILNGGDRPPGVVGILDIPGGNGGVGHGDVEFAEQLRGGGQAVALRLGGLVGDGVPGAGRRVSALPVAPEFGDLGLIGGAGGAVARAQRFGLVERVGIGLAGQAGRAGQGGRKLVGAVQREGLQIGPLRVLGRGEAGSGRLPNANTGAAGVDDVGVVAVVGAQGDDFGGRGAA